MRSVAEVRCRDRQGGMRIFSPVARGMTLNGCFSSLQPSIIPAPDPFQDINLVRSFRHTVWFSWVDDKLDWHPLLPQGAVKSGRLTERYPCILLPMQNEYRRPHIVGIGNRA